MGVLEDLLDHHHEQLAHEIHELRRIMSELSDDIAKVAAIAQGAIAIDQEKDATIASLTQQNTELQTELATAQAGDPADVAAVNAIGDALTTQFPPVVVPEALSLTAPADISVPVGTAVSGAFVAAGGTEPYTFAAQVGDPGVTVDTNGNLGGVPSVAGTSTVSVTVTDSTGATAEATLTITAS